MIVFHTIDIGLWSYSHTVLMEPGSVCTIMTRKLSSRVADSTVFNLGLIFEAKRHGVARP